MDVGCRAVLVAGALAWVGALNDISPVGPRPKENESTEEIYR
jgi:hypothetical protein